MNEPYKSIDNLIRDLHECPDEGAIEAVEEWTEWKAERYDEAVAALANNDFLYCPQCLSWERVVPCRAIDDQEATDDCDHQEHCHDCMMPVLRCCEFPVYREYGQYRPIDLTGLDFIKRYEDRVKFLHKWLWIRFGKFIGEALCARYDWDRLSRHRWQAGCVAVSVAASLDEQFNSGRRTK